MVNKYLKLIRIQHWVKNTFIFLPLFFSGELFNYQIFLNTVFIAIGFSMVCSSIYVINDLFDIEFDKIHPTKKHRPIASGEISKRQAYITCLVFFLNGIFILYLTNLLCLLLALLYFSIMILYSAYLKKLPIIDLFIISIGFIIRILIGGNASNVYVSDWTIIMVFLLSLFIAASKRRDDVIQYEEESRLNREVVIHYNLDFINSIISIISSVLIVSYLIFITQDQIILKYNSKNLFFTFIFVIIGILRFNQITLVDKQSESPIKILFNDRFMQINLSLWLILFLLMIYL